MSKLENAIANNIGLYQAILNPQDISFHLTPEVAYTEEKVPLYYSNLVTRSRNWQPDALVQQIDRQFAQQSWDGWSIKDSFHELNLTSYGFNKLFDAYWMYLPVCQFSPQATKNLRYDLIESETGLFQWRQAWDSNVEAGKAIFTPALLTNPDIWFVGGYTNGQLVSGCLINQTDDVIGISNFFASNPSVSDWSSMIRFIRNRIARKPIVGYQPKTVVNRLTTIGVEPLGKLRIWQKKR